MRAGGGAAEAAQRRHAAPLPVARSPGRSRPRGLSASRHPSPPSYSVVAPCVRAAQRRHRISAHHAPLSSLAGVTSGAWRACACGVPFIHCAPLVECGTVCLSDARVSSYRHCCLWRGVRAVVGGALRARHQRHPRRRDGFGPATAATRVVTCIPRRKSHAFAQLRAYACLLAHLPLVEGGNQCTPTRGAGSMVGWGHRQDDSGHRSVGAPQGEGGQRPHPDRRAAVHGTPPSVRASTSLHAAHTAAAQRRHASDTGTVHMCSSRWRLGAGAAWRGSSRIGCASSPNGRRRSRPVSV